MITYHIKNFDTILFDSKMWNNELTQVYQNGMENYVPYYSGDTYHSQMFLIGEDLEIAYNTDYSGDIYNGIYFGIEREPKKKYHSQATNKWAEVFTVQNEWMIISKWNQFVRRLD